MKLNHHSCGVLPFHQDEQGKVYFILEQKDPGYKPPFFDNGLNFFGGNWESKKELDDKSPSDTIERELREEFWEAYEAPEDLNDLLGQEFLKTNPHVSAQLDHASIRRLRDFSRLMYGGKFAENYVVRVGNPILNDPLKYGSTIFTKEVGADELLEARMVLNFFNGKVSTDNYKWGSQTVIASIDDINNEPMKFSWGYDHVINDLTAQGKLPESHGVLRPLSHISVSRLRSGTRSDMTTYKTLKEANTYAK